MGERECGIIAENLNIFNGRIAAALEQSLSCVDELARQMYEIAGEQEIFYRDNNFRARFSELTAGPDDVNGGINPKALEICDEMLGMAKKLFLCVRFAEIMELNGLEGAETFIDDYPSGNETVSYVRNPLSNEAFSYFSKKMSEPKVSYCENFARVCNEVRNGKSGFCITPFETSSEGRYVGFASTAIRNGLKINRICRVTAGNDGYTVFALASPCLTVPDGEDCVAEIRILNNRFGEVIEAARICGMKTVYLQSLPGCGCDIALSINSKTICGFLCWLFLAFVEEKDFIMTGLYSVNG